MIANRNARYIKITFPADWIQHRVDRLIQSTEKEKDYGDTSSFLSCIHFRLEKDLKNDVDILEMSTQSMQSTTYVHVDDLDVEGRGEFLVSATEFKNIISNFPEDSTITLTHFSWATDEHERGEILITTDDDSMSFIIMDVPIESASAMPKAEKKIPKRAPYITVDVQETRKALKNVSGMATKQDSDSIASQNPLTGCGMYIHQEGMTMFTMSMHTALFTITSDDIKTTKTKTPPCLFADIPTLTSTLGAFADNATVTFHTDGTKTLYLEDDDTIVSMNAIRAVMGTPGYSDPDSISADQIFAAYKNFSVAKKCTLELDFNASSFYNALGRARDDFDDETVLDVTGSQAEIKSFTKNRVVFRQDIPVSAQWHVEGDRKTRLVLNTRTLKKTRPFTGDSVHIAVVPKDPSTPSLTALMIYDPEDFDDENPDNFYMITSLKPLHEL